MNRDLGNKKAKNSTKLFFSGVIILTVCNLLVKAIGLLFKIPLHDIVGDTGMGYFNSAYNIYTVLYMVSTSGLPVAVSIMISRSRAEGRFRESKVIFRAAIRIFLLLGTVGTTIMVFGSKAFSAAMGAEPTYLAIIAIAPTLFFICISSAMRGYFQGHQQMVPTGISQLIEAAGKMGIGIAFAVWATRRGYEVHEVAAFTILGVTIGVAISMAYLVITKMFFREENYNLEYMDRKNNSVTPIKTIYRKLLKIAIPVTISASVMSLANLIDTVMVQKRLQSIGYSQIEATTLYGNYTTLAVPMFNLPPVLIYPIANAIVPLVSAALASKDKKRLSTVRNSAIRIVALLAVPCAFGLCVMAEPILMLFYGEASARTAAPLLSILAPATLFLCLVAISNSLLQAHHKERVPILSMLCGAIVKLISNYILMGIVGIYGTPISTVLCYITAVCVNFYFIHRYVGKVPSIKSIFLKPVAASVVSMLACVVCCLLTDLFLPAKLATLIGIMAAVVSYAVIVFLIKAITKEEILMIPKGQKIYSVLHRLHLMN